MKALEPRGYGRRGFCLADRAQRPWTNGLEDIALFWYGDALAMQGARRFKWCWRAISHDRHAMHDTLQSALSTLMHVLKLWRANFGRRLHGGQR
jgi:hypothetical protein